MRKIYFLLIFVATSITSCVPPLEEIPENTVGLAPRYASEIENWEEITLEEAKPILNLGKIYSQEPFLMATEPGYGIHVFDNNDPSNPEPLYFIRIAGITDLAARGTVLYVNNFADLVAIRFSVDQGIEIVSRTRDVFQNQTGELPANYTGFFECPDPDKGPVVAWFETILQDPHCWKNY